MKIMRENTQHLFIGSRFLCSPLEALFTLLIFILNKELNATLLQLTLLACVKPVTALFAFYLSPIIVGQPNRIKRYLIACNALGALPCLCFPFVQNGWFFIIAYAIFMTANRAVYPAWCEVLKSNVGMKSFGSVITKGTSVNFFITIFVPLLFSVWMDQDGQIWKFLFVTLAFLQLFNTAILWNVNLKYDVDSSVSSTTNWRSILNPWKDAKRLLSQDANFTKYLILFFLGGAGLVAVQPVLPHYFNENLGLSYSQLALAFSFCKGISFVASAPVWANRFKRISLYQLKAYVNLFSCLFIVLLLSAEWNLNCLFFAYVMYGTMQAGCELCWNVCGPVFAKDGESIRYSGLNLAFVGIRGCICPLLGQLLFLYSGAPFVFVCAGVLCFISLIYALWLDHELKFKEGVACGHP